jgi:hypothetical protein
VIIMPSASIHENAIITTKIRLAAENCNSLHNYNYSFAICADVQASVRSLVARAAYQRQKIPLSWKSTACARQVAMSQFRLW